MNLATTAIVYLLELNAGITDTVRTLCKEKALRLQCFQSASTLLKAIKSTEPAYIIADNDQPTGQALELLKKLEDKELQVPVIILGHHSDIPSAVAAIKAGAIDYIEKPSVYGRLSNHFNQFIKRSTNRKKKFIHSSM